MTVAQLRDRVHHRPFNSLWWAIFLTWLVVGAAVFR